MGLNGVTEVTHPDVVQNNLVCWVRFKTESQRLSFGSLEIILLFHLRLQLTL
jgi:hypothetical protein